jgi:hypothetical protein
LIRLLAADTSLRADDVWVADSTPAECGRSRDTAHRSDLAGWAQYGYCASHSRYFWGLRLHLVATLGGLPIAFALTGAKADERQTLLGTLAASPDLAAERPGQTLIADRQYYGAQFEATLTRWQVQLLRPARKGERERPGAHLFKPLRQTIESINQTFKAQPGPRTTRRPHPRRRARPGPAAHPGPHRSHLARPHQSTAPSPSTTTDPLA